MPCGSFSLIFPELIRISDYFQGITRDFLTFIPHFTAIYSDFPLIISNSITYFLILKLIFNN